MQSVIAEVGFEGDLRAFNEFLRTDPQFYYDRAEALLEGYQAVSKRLDPALVKLFGKLPRAPYGGRPIPEEDPIIAQFDPVRLEPDCSRRSEQPILSTAAH